MATSTIGTGRDYSTITAWEAATDNDLVTATEGEIGEVYDDVDYAESLLIFGATTNATYYRELKAAGGEEYDPISDTGVTWDHSGVNTYVTWLAENYFRMSGMELAHSDTNGKAVHTGSFAPTACLIERCVFRADANTQKSGIGIVDWLIGTATFRNCLFIGTRTVNAGAPYGLNISDDAGICTVQNCVAYGLEDNGAFLGTGFLLDIAVACVFRNCISMDCGDADFNLNGAADPDYNCSSDATAAGGNSLQSQTSSAVFTAHASDDFTLLKNSPALQVGEDLSGSFSQSFQPGVNHGDANGTWNMGAYDGPAIPSRQRKPGRRSYKTRFHGSLGLR